MEEKERYEVKRLDYSLNVKLTDNSEPDWRYIIFDSVNDKELAKLETVCDWLNQKDKRIKNLEEKISIQLNNNADNVNFMENQRRENQQLKQQLEYKNNTIQGLLETQLMLESSCSYQVFLDCQDEIKQLKQQLAESEKSNEYFADRIEKADKEIKEIYKKYNELVEEYNNIKEEVDNNFVDGQKYNQLKQQLHDLCIEDNQKDKDFLRKQIKHESDARNKFMKENQQLKQQLQDLPKKIVGEIKNNCWYGGALLEDNYYKVTDKLVDTILKKFGGENESK